MSSCVIDSIPEEYSFIASSYSIVFIQLRANSIFYNIRLPY